MTNTTTISHKRKPKHNDSTKHTTPATNTPNKQTTLNKNFQAGNIHNHLDRWKQITDDKLVIQWIQEGFPLQWKTKPPPEQHTKWEGCLTTKTLQELLQYKVIERLPLNHEYHTSPILGIKDSITGQDEREHFGATR